jgi:hypothetical protein
MTMSAAIRDRIEGQPGAFAAAVLTGDRSGLDAETVENMRVANIAHLLAISGLHMGLLTGFVYGALRLALALIPALALQPSRSANGRRRGRSGRGRSTSCSRAATWRRNAPSSRLPSCSSPSCWTAARSRSARSPSPRSCCFCTGPRRCSRPASRCRLPPPRRWLRCSTACAARRACRAAPDGRNGFSRWSCPPSSPGWPRPPSRRRISTGSPSTGWPRTS